MAERPFFAAEPHPAVRTPLLYAPATDRPWLPGLSHRSSSSLPEGIGCGFPLTFFQVERHLGGGETLAEIWAREGQRGSSPRQKSPPGLWLTCRARKRLFHGFAQGRERNPCETKGSVGAVPAFHRDTGSYVWGEGPGKAWTPGRDGLARAQETPRLPRRGHRQDC